MLGTLFCLRVWGIMVWNDTFMLELSQITQAMPGSIKQNQLEYFVTVRIPSRMPVYVITIMVGLAVKIFWKFWGLAGNERIPIGNC